MSSLSRARVRTSSSASTRRSPCRRDHLSESSTRPAQQLGPTWYPRACLASSTPASCTVAMTNATGPSPRAREDRRWARPIPLGGRCRGQPILPPQRDHETRTVAETESMATVTARRRRWRLRRAGNRTGPATRHRRQELMSRTARLPRYSATKIEKGTRNTVMRARRRCSLRSTTRPATSTVPWRRGCDTTTG